MGQKGVGALFKVGQRLGRVIKSLGLYDQNSLLPIANLEETANSVNSQRKLFLEEWLPHLISSPLERARFKRNIAAIDNKLLLKKEIYNSPEEEMVYLRQRHKLLKVLVEKIICGDHIAEEKHQKYLQRHHELSSENATTLAYFLTTVIFALKVLKSLYQGLYRRILAVNDYCYQQKVKLNIGVVTLGRDPLVLSQDYARFIEIAAKRQVLIDNFIFEDEEHSSVAYKWGLIDALEELKFIKNISARYSNSA